MDYYRQVEDLFASLRGAPHILSPRDFQLLREWWRDGVPLAAVVTGLTEIFARARDLDDGDPVVSLSYCRHAVRRQAKRLATMHIGAGNDNDATVRTIDPAGVDRLTAALDTAAAACRNDLPGVAEVVERTSRQVATAARELAADLLDEHLFALEAALLEGCWQALPEATRSQIGSKASEAATASAATADARRRSELALRDRELRRFLGLPRLEVIP